jgi:hypothetical protein
LKQFRPLHIPRTYREAKSMSISFRSDFGPDMRVMTGSPAEARTTDSMSFATPVPPAIFAVAQDPRSTDNRPPEPRAPDLRSIDARLTEIKNGANPRDLSDVKMDQIRELLFGEVQRQSEQRITLLEAKFRDLETSFQQRLDAMQARIDALSAETRGDRRSTLDELARGISDLGERVKRIPRD